MNKLIHQSSIIYLAFIILLRMLAMPLSLLDYSLNKTFIANHFCENRSNLQMHCYGKCYLNKQLTKANESQDSRDQKGTVKNLLIDFFERPDNPSFGCSGVIPDHTGQFEDPFTGSRFFGNIFHPPIA